MDAEIAVKGGIYRRDYGKSHGTGLVDAIIMASAEIRGAKLVTLNKRHFPTTDDVIIPYIKEWIQDQDDRFKRKVVKIFEKAGEDKRYSIWEAD